MSSAEFDRRASSSAAREQTLDTGARTGTTTQVGALPQRPTYALLLDQAEIWGNNFLKLLEGGARAGLVKRGPERQAIDAIVKDMYNSLLAAGQNPAAVLAAARTAIDQKGPALLVGEAFKGVGEPIAKFKEELGSEHATTVSLATLAFGVILNGNPFSGFFKKGAAKAVEGAIDSHPSKTGSAVAKSVHAWEDGATPKPGEVWTFKSISQNYYSGVFHGYDAQGRTLLDLGRGPEPLNTARLVTGRRGKSAPELHSYGPNDVVTVYSIRGNPHTGRIIGYDERGNVRLVVESGKEEVLRIDQLDLRRTQPHERTSADYSNLPREANHARVHEAPNLVHYGANAQEHVALATRLGLMPRRSIQVNNATFRVGQLFDIGDGRVAALIEVEIDGKRHLRMVYQSNSQGGFRVLPARNIKIDQIPGYDKLTNENAISVPNEVEELLAAQRTSGQLARISPDDASAVLNGAVPINRSYMDWHRYRNNEDYIGKGITTRKLLEKPTDVLPTAYQGHELPVPSQVRISVQSQRPNFSTAVRSYKTSTAMSGEVDALVYRSHDSMLEYTVYRDDRNHVWFKGISAVDSSVTPHGVHAVAIDAEALCVPLWEYSGQIPEGYGGASHGLKPQYESSWKYLREIPEIQAWYHATGISIPRD